MHAVDARRTTRLITVTMILLAILSADPARAAEAANSDATLSQQMEEAVRVLVLAKRDGVAAAKQVQAVFSAAHALEEKGRESAALDYFQEGLKLSPWNLAEQLAYAALLIRSKQPEDAKDIARMVSGRAESDNLANAARGMLGEPPVAPPPTWDGKAMEGPWLCFIKVGTVDDAVLRESMAKMSTTLGIPARLLDEKIGLPKPHRSSFDRWVAKQVIPKVKWFTPPAKRLLRSLDATVPEDVPPRKLIAALIRSLEADGQDREAANLQEAAAHYEKSDRQWNAPVLLGTVAAVLQQRENLKSAIIVAVTSVDLFDGESNFVFGGAPNGKRICIVSLARFRADFTSEPPDRSRLVVRLHKQLLSSIGFALDVPRPTDPTSARAYPASMAEHDAKSEFMSASCAAGFERALGRPLPPGARPPEQR